MKSFLRLILVVVAVLQIFDEARAQDTSSTESIERRIGKSEIASCDFIWTRHLDSRLRVTPHETQSLAMAKAIDDGASTMDILKAQLSGEADQGYLIKLATGESHGNPYDAMGIGTFVKVTSDAWVTICDITF